MSTFIGVDISRWQGNVDFSALSKAVSFVLYKGTGADSGLYVDPEFLRNHAQARAYKMRRGIYHYGGGTDPAQEARYFYDQCLTNLSPGEVVALDAEWNQALNPSWCLIFLQTLEHLIGFKPMIYMNQNTMLTKDWTAVAKANYGLWLADWDGDPNIIVQMKYWSFCAIQQYTNRGHVAGIVGSVDEDGFFAPELSFWDKYGKPTPAPAPAPKPVPAPAPTPPPVPAPQPVIPAAPSASVSDAVPPTSTGPTELPSSGGPANPSPNTIQDVKPPVGVIVPPSSDLPQAGPPMPSPQPNAFVRFLKWFFSFKWLIR